jgi:transcriptional antiterminator NusG
MMEDKIKEIFADEPIAPAEPEAPEPEAAVPVETEEAEAPKDPNLKWYVIHTYSGYENKVKTNLERRTKTMHGQGGERIAQVLVPTEKEKEIKGGKRREVDRKIYPGYVLVEMIMEDDSWYVVRNTPGVTGFVGSGARPVPLEDAEVKRLLKQLRDETPKYRISFQKGSVVRITQGPFQDFTGVVDEVMVEKEKVRVLVSIFGRATPVELSFGQIEKT